MKKLLFSVLIAAAVLFGAALQSLAVLKNQDDPFEWDEVDEFDFSQAVLDWEAERYEEDLKDLEGDA